MGIERTTIQMNDFYYVMIMIYNTTLHYTASIRIHMYSCKQCDPPVYHVDGAKSSEGIIATRTTRSSPLLTPLENRRYMY
jgi:hypothetical protein